MASSKSSDVNRQPTISYIFSRKRFAASSPSFPLYSGGDFEKRKSLFPSAGNGDPDVVPQQHNDRSAVLSAGPAVGINTSCCFQGEELPLEPPGYEESQQQLYHHHQQRPRQGYPRRHQYSISGPVPGASSGSGSSSGGLSPLKEKRSRPSLSLWSPRSAHSGLFSSMFPTLVTKQQPACAPADSPPQQQGPPGPSTPSSSSQKRASTIPRKPLPDQHPNHLPQTSTFNSFSVDALESLGIHDDGPPPPTLPPHARHPSATPQTNVLQPHERLNQQQQQHNNHLQKPQGAKQPLPPTPLYSHKMPSKLIQKPPRTSSPPTAATTAMQPPLDMPPPLPSRDAGRRRNSLPHQQHQQRQQQLQQPQLLQQPQQLLQKPPPVLPKQPQQPHQPQHQREKSLGDNNNNSGRRLQPRHVSPSPDARGRSSSAQPPRTGSGGGGGGGQSNNHPRVVSDSSPGPRPQSAHSSEHSPSRGRLRRSWLPGGRSRDPSTGPSGAAGGSGSGSGAWVLAPEGRADYSTNFLKNGEKVPELWNESGDVLVYLFPRASGIGPSFKVRGSVLAESAIFTHLIHAEMSSPLSSRPRAMSFGGRDSLSAQDALSIDGNNNNVNNHNQNHSGDCSRLYIAESPMGAQTTPSLDRLVDLRNLFAFLTGQPLVGTKHHPSVFAVLLRIAALLREFDFNAPDDSFGSAVNLSFSFYADEMALADVRHSREKTIEGLVLGEQMRSWGVYNESFTHCVGKYEAVMDLKSPLYEQQVSLSTRQRLERAHLDLRSRQDSVNTRLESFGFPSLFAGTASSTSNPDFREVRFGKWEAYFRSMRGFVLKHYKSQYGNWPPKARSKKNPFSESGLNRQVLRQLYSDLCALYDLLVDRESLTTRIMSLAQEARAEEAEEEEEEGRKQHGGGGGASELRVAEMQALRKVLSEYDSSSPPVLPPVPFDIPKIPSMTSVNVKFDGLPHKEQVRVEKRMQHNELQLIMHKSYNFDTDMLQNVPFLTSFKEFELKEAKGRSLHDLADQRIGYWLFLYVVLQSLPMLCVDAPEVHFTEGVEYFLCSPPMGNPPWLDDAEGVRKVWYKTRGGEGGLVELSADVVMFSVEATYHRSHCWAAAKRWAEAAREGAGVVDQHMLDRTTNTFNANAATPTTMLSPLEPPHPVFPSMAAGSAPTMGTGTPPSSGAASSGTAGQPLPVHHRPRGRSPAVAGGRDPGAALRASLYFDLEPVNFPPPPPPGGDGYGSPGGGSAGGNRSSRHFSSGSVGLSGGVAAAAGGPLLPPATEQRPRPPHMGRSASAGNLKLMVNQGAVVGGGGGGGGYPPHHYHHHQHHHSGSGSAGGLSPSPHGRSGSAVGSASTPLSAGMSFDDILKGMDDQKVKKKKSWLPV